MSCVPKTDRKNRSAKRQIPEISDGIKNAARDTSNNVKPSLLEEFAIEKAEAGLKRPRSSIYHTEMFGYTSGRTMWMCTSKPPNSIGRAEYYRVTFETSSICP